MKSALKSKEEKIARVIEKANKQHLDQDHKVLCNFNYLEIDITRWDSEAKKSVDELSV